MLASDIFKWVKYMGYCRSNVVAGLFIFFYFIKKHRNVLLSCQSKEQTVEAVFISVNNEVRNSHNVF